MILKYVNDDKGFSFIETLAALAIMLILTAGVGLASYKIIDQARRVSAKNQIEIYKTALNAYYLDCGVYPNEAQGIQALFEKPIIAPVSSKWNGPYIDKQVLPDPWGNEYVYKTLNDYGLPFIISSYGADGVSGGKGNDEDINSWK